MRNGSWMSSSASRSSLSAAARLPTPDRASPELVDDRAQQPAIDFVEPLLVDFQHLQRLARDLGGDRAVGPDLRVVPDPPQ